MTDEFHGFRGGFAAAPLHPWLQSCAPPGDRPRNKTAVGTIDYSAAVLRCIRLDDDSMPIRRHGTIRIMCQRVACRQCEKQFAARPGTLDRKARLNRFRDGTLNTSETQTAMVPRNTLTGCNCPSAWPSLRNATFFFAGLLLLSGCSSFESRWDAAATRPALPHSLEGRWEGTWLSDGHTGSLRCTITHKVADTYHADFQAQTWDTADFCKVLHLAKEVDLHARVESPGKYRFEGDSDFDWLAGGKYHYEGSATGDASDVFSCTYKTAWDHGEFNMSRVAAARRSVE